ncbi:hypothetical protein [Pelagovum pacificum]|uniref:Phage holin family protein n=1 Tax=Pelagovum pacificum TaxID=2588711 RepID=A0A5C5G9N4_9RHOB|nr:hypothetical protein [Pelagovum pacificum]QQA41869.1 hypothetical protein I8N54_13825 [Pelagovum pacificum]TNY30688.1 hypothetical protein FHY64_19105 [Pelagovum pacificum]
MNGLLYAVEARAALAARRAAFGVVGLVLMLIGLGFLSLSGWLALAAATTPIQASLIIGGAYFGVGLIVLVIASVRRYRVPASGSTAAMASATPNGNMLPAAVQAFMVGLTAGMTSGRRR